MSSIEKKTEDLIQEIYEDLEKAISMPCPQWMQHKNSAIGKLNTLKEKRFLIPDKVKYALFQKVLQANERLWRCKYLNPECINENRPQMKGRISTMLNLRIGNRTPSFFNNNEKSQLKTFEQQITEMHEKLRKIITTTGIDTEQENDLHTKIEDLIKKYNDNTELYGKYFDRVDALKRLYNKVYEQNLKVHDSFDCIKEKKKVLKYDYMDEYDLFV